MLGADRAAAVSKAVAGLVVEFAQLFSVEFMTRVPSRTGS